MRLAALVAAVLVACIGDSPTEPGATTTLATRYGTATVRANGHEFNAERAKFFIEAGYSRAALANERALRVPLDGMLIVVGPISDAIGAYKRSTDTVYMNPGVESVLAHEVGDHRICDFLGLPRMCCVQIGHPGGYPDLTCTRNTGTAQAGFRSHEVTLRIYPHDRDEVHVIAEGACGDTCGVKVEWRSSTEGRLIDRTEGISAYLYVERDVPMLVTMKVTTNRDSRVGGKRFMYDGRVNPL